MGSPSNAEGDCQTFPSPPPKWEAIRVVVSRYESVELPNAFRAAESDHLAAAIKRMLDPGTSFPDAPTIPGQATMLAVSTSSAPAASACRHQGRKSDAPS